MHPESLANYKLQVYNPGSLTVAPKSDPLKTLPRASLDPENPLKLTIFSKVNVNDRKRPSSIPEFKDLLESPKKKPSMMSPEELKSLHKKLREESKKDMTYRRAGQNESSV